MSDTEMPQLSDNDSDSDWEEMEEAPIDVDCLFCSNHFVSITVAIEHLESVHGLNLAAFKSKHNMDCYSYIKMVNFIRRTNISSSELLASAQTIWNCDDNLRPVIDADPWLMFDFEHHVTERCDVRPIDSSVSKQDGLVQMTENHYESMLSHLQNLQVEVTRRDQLLETSMNDMKKMAEVTKSIIEGPSNDIGDDASQGSMTMLNNSVCNLDISDDVAYFDSYGHYGIHHDMLSDKVRTESYRDAILNNSETMAGRTVLDVGCGTGILSMFAATAGASHVYAVDMSDVVYQAMDIIRENNLSDKITLIKGRMEDIQIPGDKVDIIISEWMGYFLLFEGMLDSIIYSRDHHLKPGGILLPNRCNISLVGSGDMDRHNQLLGFWSDVYGFKMNCMKTDVVQEALVDIADKNHIITSTAVLAEFDINTCKADCVNFECNFTLNVTKTGSLTCLVGFFDTFFDLPNPVQFTTGPSGTPTHWKQTLFYFKTPYPVQEGDVITCDFQCKRDAKNVRGLAVKLNIFGNVHKYLVS